MEDLSKISGYSASKIKRLIYHWLSKESIDSSVSLNQIKYLVYDATYFHKDGCFAIVFDPVKQQIIKTLYCHREGHNQVIAWFGILKENGLNPLYISMDGEQGVMRAFKSIWPQVRIQRCLFHVQHEGCRWLRRNPDTEAAKTLKKLLIKLTNITSVKEQKQFTNHFKFWKKKHQEFVKSLPQNITANVDIHKTITLITRALPDMFYYINDPKIRSTSNIIEALNGRIKKAYRQHQGLTHKHKIQFLNWYCYYENQHKTNIL